MRKATFVAGLTGVALLTVAGAATATFAVAPADKGHQPSPSLACPSPYKATRTNVNGLDAFICAKPGHAGPAPTATVTVTMIRDVPQSTATATVTVTKTVTMPAAPPVTVTVTKAG